MYRVYDFPEIWKNFYLESRNAGPSKRLRGKVAIITVFAKRTYFDWQSDQIDKYYSELNKASNFLIKEARRYGTRLEIVNYKAEVNVPTDADPKKGYNLIKDAFGITTMKELQFRYERLYSVDEAIVLLVFNQQGRSFAFEDMTPFSDVDELSVIFYSSLSHESYEHTISHEILHQFGAQDYYYPKEVTEAAKFCFNQSVMGLGGMVVDDLTAYLVGWKDTISDMSYCFLRSTMWMTPEKYSQALRDEWKRT
jgi:hypothetical protein